MGTLLERIKSKRGTVPVLLASVAWLFCAIAVPVHEASAESYTSGCGPLVCVDRDSVLSTLAVHDDDVKSKPSQITLYHIKSSKKDGAQHTIRVDASSEAAHLKHGDTLGTCVDTVMQAFVNSLPTCTVLNAAPTVKGVWVPKTAIGDGTGLNVYFFQVQDGSCSGVPDSSAENYREIHGQ